MRLDRDRPEILQPPEHPQACCTQQAITVPPEVGAKTRQKHDYPSAAWRRSYARRTGAERGFATAKDPASSDITRGWCRLMGLAPLMLFVTSLLASATSASSHAWNARQEENQRRAAKGLPPKTRRRRRKTLAALTAPPRPDSRPARTASTNPEHRGSASTPAHRKSTARTAKKGASGAPPQPGTGRTTAPPEYQTKT